MRPEEAIALAFLLPTTWLTAIAYNFAPEMGEIGPRFVGGVLRLITAIFCIVILAITAKKRPALGSPLYFIREMLPFLVCILVYTNLHDTIGFINPHDIHDTLIAIDQAVFGVQPCVWTEQFITSSRTEIFEFFYASFLLIAVIVPTVLLAEKRTDEFRRASFNLIVCFFIGYVLYIIFPAAPPRLTLTGEFTKNLGGYPSFLSAASAKAFAMLPSTSRAAFPSLHCAISLLALMLAFRYERRLFWFLLPLCLGLWPSTIYLRHHYAVDLVAGFVLAPVAYWLAPRIDAWWHRKRDQ